jgi:hypothetical protein
MANVMCLCSGMLKGDIFEHASAKCYLYTL